MEHVKEISTNTQIYFKDCRVGAIHNLLYENFNFVMQDTISVFLCYTMHAFSCMVPMSTL